MEFSHLDTMAKEEIVKTGIILFSKIMKKIVLLSKTVVYFSVKVLHNLIIMTKIL